MTAQTKTVIKSYLETGDIPTQAQFADLVDSYVDTLALGTGVATFLATPSSTNLAAAVTGETGTGALVFGTGPTLTSPTLVTPALGAATLTSLTFPGGTTLSNFLESEYTASVTCGASGTITLTNNTAAYTRNGNTVSVQGLLSVASVSSPVGTLNISLPFPAANLTQTAGYTAAIIVLENTVSSNAGMNAAAIAESSSVLTGYTASATNITNLLANQIKAGTSIYFQATYRIA